VRPVTTGGGGQGAWDRLEDRLRAWRVVENLADVGQVSPDALEAGAPL
jgi:hypothetical protein